MNQHMTPHVLRDIAVSAIHSAFGGLHDGGAWALTMVNTTEDATFLTFTIGTKYNDIPQDLRQTVHMRIAVTTPVLPDGG